MTRLDQLNNLLKHQDIPEFRKTVDHSGTNLKWLKKHVFSKDTCPSELKELLELSIQDLNHIEVPAQ